MDRLFVSFHSLLTLCDGWAVLIIQPAIFFLPIVRAEDTCQ
jgi:hypothetical protein